MGRCKTSFAAVFFCVLWSSLPHFSNGVIEMTTEEAKAGGRQLLQNTQLPCPEDYNFFNFQPVTSVCFTPDNTTDLSTYPVKACCQSLCKVVGTNGTYINDMNYDCASVFFSYLTMAGNYPPAFFANLCTDPNSDKGIACPAETDPTPPPPPGGGVHSTKASSLLLSFLVAAGVFEAIILLV